MEKCEILIKDRNLFERMVKNQHSLVEREGKYSLDKRKERLIKLINPHIN